MRMFSTTSLGRPFSAKRRNLTALSVSRRSFAGSTGQAKAKIRGLRVNLLKDAWSIHSFPRCRRTVMDLRTGARVGSSRNDFAFALRVCTMVVFGLPIGGFSTTRRRWCLDKRGFFYQTLSYYSIRQGRLKSWNCCTKSVQYVGGGRRIVAITCSIPGECLTISIDSVDGINEMKSCCLWQRKMDETLLSKTARHPFLPRPSSDHDHTSEIGDGRNRPPSTGTTKNSKRRGQPNARP